MGDRAEGNRHVYPISGAYTYKHHTSHTIDRQPAYDTMNDTILNNPPTQKKVYIKIKMNSMTFLKNLS